MNWQSQLIAQIQTHPRFQVLQLPSFYPGSCPSKPSSSFPAPPLTSWRPVWSPSLTRQWACSSPSQSGSWAAPLLHGSFSALAVCSCTAWRFVPHPLLLCFSLSFSHLQLLLLLGQESQPFQLLLAPCGAVLGAWSVREPWVSPACGWSHQAPAHAGAGALLSVAAGPLGHWSSISSADPWAFVSVLAHLLSRATGWGLLSCSASGPHSLSLGCSSCLGRFSKKLALEPANSKAVH